MDPVMAMVAVPLLIWAGVFGFMLSVDRRVRSLEQQVKRSEVER